MRRDFEEIRYVASKAYKADPGGDSQDCMHTSDIYTCKIKMGSYGF